MDIKTDDESAAETFAGSSDHLPFAPLSGLRTRLPLGHFLALGLVLFALLPVAGTQAVWSADEGALLYQVEAVADGRGWVFDHPFPEADPDGTYFPIHLSSWAPENSVDSHATAPGYVVLGKHVAYLWIAVGLYKLGGYGLLVAFSVAATWAAAVATARLAARVEPAAQIPALWLAGLASPLFIHGYVAWGHTVAAALIGWGGYGLLAGRHRSIWRPAGLVLLFLACQIRTEAPLATLSIGVGLLTIALFDPSVPTNRQRDRATTGLAASATGVLGVVVDRATAIRTGGPVEPVPFDEAFGAVSGRLEAFFITWLQPAYGSDPIDLLILLAATTTVIAAVLARRGHTHSGAQGPSAAPVRAPLTVTPTVLALLVLALLALVVRAALGQAALVPGLVVAFPVLFAGLALLNRHTIFGDRAIELLAPFGLFCGAVLATQYRHGGGGEWGGRYFALGLPLGIAAAAVGLVRAGALLKPRDRYRLGGLLVAAMAIMSSLGLLGLRAVRAQTDHLATDIRQTVNRFEPDDDGPVVVSTLDGLGRWMWSDVDDGRWLRVPENDLASVGQRLRLLGVQELALVSRNQQRELRELDPWYEPAAESPDTGLAATPDESPIPVIALRARN